jgi:hypothetical protein
MLDDATLETFSAHVARPFTVRLLNGERLTVTLESADLVPGDGDPRRTRAPFSLIFRVPQGARLAQGTYVIEREGFGAIDIFLVPILPDRDGPRLQAIFA